MEQKLIIYNTLSRKKEEFIPLARSACRHVRLRAYCIR